MLNVAIIAMICHNINKAYCESIGDHSQPIWAEAPQWQRDSAVTGVKFHLENLDSKPSDSHESWLKEKKEDGWKYGPVKLPAKKEHPCFVPYEELPKEQQAKDFLFLETVRSLEPYLSQNGHKAEAGTPNRELTFGEKAVGIKFNPSNSGPVHECKQMFANCIDQMNDLRTSSEDAGQKRHCSAAITQIEDAQMRAVKAITWTF